MTTRLERHFADRDVEFIYLQTVFEGFDQNDFARAESEQARWSLAGPVGHDVPDRPGDPGSRPHTMQDYRTGGTPWTIVVDREGYVRFNDFTRDFNFHRAMIQALL